MPIYEFECPQCGRRREVIRKTGDYTRPVCNGYAMELVSSISSFRIDNGPLAGIPRHQSAMFHGHERLD